MLLHSTNASNLCGLSIVTKFVSRHIHLHLFSFGNMNSGNKGQMGSSPRSSNTSSRSYSDSQQMGGNGPSEFYSRRGEIPHNRSQVSKQNKHQSASPSFSVCSYNEQFPPLGVKSSSISSDGQFNVRKTMIDIGAGQKEENIVSTQLEESPVSYYVHQHNGPSPSTPIQNKGVRPHVKASLSNQSFSKHEAGVKKWDSSEGLHNVKPFDICLSRRYFNMQKQNKFEQTVDWTREGVLRPGMVLLKHYLTIREQIIIVRTCQELGNGPCGFYQPGYNDGAKLRLRMMCLGLDWDPQTRKYGKKRQVDGCEPPVIPSKFKQLVQNSISEAHDLIKMDSEVNNVEDVFPALSPDICIVNFYNTSGRLGLHQDRDESRHSLKKGLPVVSFSVGDSAEFLFGDERDVNKAEKVLLESGDVLIFGGESRLVFHGVSSIISNSAPGALLEKTMLRPGRLNLTFRKY